MISRKWIAGIGLTLACVLLSGAAPAGAETLARRQNLANLIADAEIILHGDVISVTDGVDATLPYTEVRIKVRETLRGTAGEVYTFRQFGLLRPRSMGNGLVNYAVNPAGWATYRPNEEVILFLYRSAKRTGLRTTVGLGQGKFTVQAGMVTSQAGNVGLFQGLSVDDTLLGAADKRMLATAKGPVSATTFLSLVRRAVAGRWVETRRMTNAQ